MQRPCPFGQAPPVSLQYPEAPPVTYYGLLCQRRIGAIRGRNPAGRLARRRAPQSTTLTTLTTLATTRCVDLIVAELRSGGPGRWLQAASEHRGRVARCTPTLLNGRETASSCPPVMGQARHANPLVGPNTTPDPLPPAEYGRHRLRVCCCRRRPRCDVRQPERHLGHQHVLHPADQRCPTTGAGASIACGV
jgi:hypothetical protein